MAAVFDKPSLRQRLSPMLQGFDGPLAFAVFLLACAGLLTMYSTGYDYGSRFSEHARNMVLAGTIMFVVAQIPPQRLMSFAVPLYVLGVALLVAVAVFGVTKDPFIVFTSNIFAILGLRSMFFALEGLLHLFRFLKQGLSVILVLIGLKLLVLRPFEEQLGLQHAEALMLGLVAAVLAASIGLSAAFPAPKKKTRSRNK